MMDSRICAECKQPIPFAAPVLWCRDVQMRSVFFDREECREAWLKKQEAQCQTTAN